MEHYELRVLADYTHTGAQAANTWDRPTPRSVLGELERDERAEVVFAEIFSPVTGAGVAEDLRKVIPVLDGERYGEYVSLSGIRDSVMVPPKQHIWGAKLYSFGTPMSNNPILSTTLKYSHTLTYEALAGPAGITQPYRVRFWGLVYKVEELSRVFGTMLFPTSLVDKARQRSLDLVKGAVVVNGDTWKTLPGGKDQAIPKVNPLIRYAFNANATDGKSGDYQFRYETGNVIESDEEMWFEFDEKDALFVEGVGVRAPANLAVTALKIAGDYHPKGLIPTTQFNNPLHFGWASPLFPATIPLFYAIPKLEKPLLIWDEIGIVIVQDNGVIVPANSIVVALTGIRIEMHG